MALATQEQEVLEAGELSLSELATEANLEHEACLSAARTTLEHAIRCGELLLIARSKCPPRGGWLKWLADEFHASKTTALAYMRLAYYREEIPQDASRTEALQMLKGLPSPTRVIARKGTPVLVDTAKEMRQAGMGYEAIAKELDINRGHLYLLLNPDSAHKRQRKIARDREARRAWIEQKQMRAARQSARKVGGAREEAWLIVERFQDLLAQVEHETPDGPEKNRHITAAWLAYHNLRDDIVKLMGIY